MKNQTNLSLIISLTMFGCAQEEKSPIEGAWQLVYGKWNLVDNHSTEKYVRVK